MNKINVVFLDIDGVLQPYDAECRFLVSNESLIDELSAKYNTDYHQYSPYDIYAVYYDWEETAISRLKHILDETKSKIIISSDWRSEKFPNKMRDLLKIQGLDKYWYADNIIINDYIILPKRRALEINDSLNKYPINKYVIIDDMIGLSDYFKENTVQTKNYMTLNDMKESIRILKR